MFNVRRREFIALLGGAAAAWPLAARGQQTSRVRQLGILNGFAESDAAWQANLMAFREALRELGWEERRNIRIDTRWAVADHERMRAHAAELLAQSPDVVFASPHSAAAVMHAQTRTIPIVVVQAGDLVSAGLVQSHARPSGNVTGFLLFEATINTKYLQLLKDIAPHLTRVAVMQAQGSTWRGDFAAVEAVANAFAIEPVAAVVRDAEDIERAIAGIARGGNGGLILPPDATTNRYRKLIAASAIAHRLPTISAGRPFVAAGVLMGYGSDYKDIFRRAAGYVDRILKGEKPADLPVQAPSKFELVINLKTAKALGLVVPPPLLIRADEVIE